MSKDKKKKKFFQGMEHLQKQYSAMPQASTTIQQSVNNDESQEENIHHPIKKELISILIIMSLLFLLLVGLMVIDKKGNTLNKIAQRITSVVIKE